MSKALVEKLSVVVSRMSCPWPQRRLAVQGVASFRDKAGTVLPATLTFDNALNDDGEWSAARAIFKSKFNPFHQLHDGLAIQSIGAALSAGEKSAIITHLRDIIRKPDVSSLDIAIGLVESMRWLSCEREHATIGASGYVMAVPKANATASDSGRPTLIVAGPPAENVPTFFYYSESGAMELRSPLFVLGDAVVGDFRAGYL